MADVIGSNTTCILAGVKRLLEAWYGVPCDLAFGHAGVAAIISVGIPLQAASAASLQLFASPPSMVTPSSAASSPSGHHSSGHAAAIAVPVVLAVALVACG